MENAKKIRLIVVCILIALSTALSIKFAKEKSGYYIDEGMTMVLANGSYNGAVTSNHDFGIGDFLNEYVIKDTFSETISNVYDMIASLAGKGNYSSGDVEWYNQARSMFQGQFTWTLGSDLSHEVMAEKGNRFNYAQVYVNQVLDVHPPLYYAIVHTLFSIFSDIFSKYLLFAVNIIFLIASTILIFYICEKWWNKSNISVLACTIWCLCQGYFSCAVYFRMYAMLTMFVLLNYYLHSSFVNKSEITKKSKWGLIISTILGSWTHYYFYVFLAPLALVNFIYLFRNNKMVLKEYIKSIVISAVISLLIWPFSIYHMLFSYRGTEATQNLIHGSFFEKLKEYSKELSNALFGHQIGLVILIILFVCIITYILYLDRFSIKKLSIRKIQTMVVIISYLLLMVKITPTQSDRYIFCILPLIAIAFAWLISSFVNKLEIKIKMCIVSVVVLMLLINAFLWITPNYLYMEQEGLKLALEGDCSDYNCLTVMDDDASAYAYISDIYHFNQVLSIGFKDIDYLVENRPSNPSLPMVVYISGFLDNEELRNQIQEALDVMELRPIESNYTAVNAYLVKN